MSDSSGVKKFQSGKWWKQPIRCLNWKAFFLGCCKNAKQIAFGSRKTHFRQNWFFSIKIRICETNIFYFSQWQTIIWLHNFFSQEFLDNSPFLINEIFMLRHSPIRIHFLSKYNKIFFNKQHKYPGIQRRTTTTQITSRRDSTIIFFFFLSLSVDKKENSETFNSSFIRKVRGFRVTRFF